MEATRGARPVAMHDTTELERLQRAERRAFYVVCIVAPIALSALAINVPALLGAWS